MIVHAVIVTFNGMNWIEDCISSILQSSIPLQIIVVDNNSADTTTSFIKDNHPEIVLLDQAQNLGFGAANNLGISYALKNDSDYILLLNQDAFIEKNTIESLISVYENNNEFGIISPIHLNGLGDNLDFNFLNYIQKNSRLVFDAFKNNYSKDIYEVPFVNAAAWLIPSKTINTVGGFDPLFFHYGEDDNYCQRVLFHDLKIGVVPDTYINHDREYRKEKDFLSPSRKILLRERYLKTKWANINIETSIDILKQQIKLRKLILKLILKLKFKKMKHYLIEYRLMKRIIPEIIKSRKINKQKGTHYLSIFK